MVKKGGQIDIENEVTCLSDSHCPVPFSTGWHYYWFLVYHPETVYTFMSMYKYLHIHEHTQHTLFCSSPFLITPYAGVHSGSVHLDVSHLMATDVPRGALFLDYFSPVVRLFLSAPDSATVNILGFESLHTCVYTSG